MSVIEDAGVETVGRAIPPVEPPVDDGAWGGIFGGPDVVSGPYTPAPLDALGSPDAANLATQLQLDLGFLHPAAVAGAGAFVPPPDPGTIAGSAAAGADVASRAGSVTAGAANVAGNIAHGAGQVVGALASSGFLLPALAAVAGLYFLNKAGGGGEKKQRSWTATGIRLALLYLIATNPAQALLVGSQILGGGATALGLGAEGLDEVSRLMEGLATS